MNLKIYLLYFNIENTFKNDHNFSLKFDKGLIKYEINC
jgi:hypothetical protein